MDADNESELLRSAALQNAQTIALARRRAEQELLKAKEALESRTQELAHSLSMLRATLESTTDGILVTDEKGRVTGFNKNYVELWQIPPAVLDAREHRILIDHVAGRLCDPDVYRARLTEIYATWPEDSFDVLEEVAGRVIERFSKVQRIENRNVGRVWSFRDITERTNAERAILQQREWFKVTLSSIGDAVITTDAQGQVTFLNPVAEAMTGWKTTEACGRPLEEVFRIIHEHTRQTVTNPVATVLREDRVVALANHTALIARDGRETAIEDSAAPIRDASGQISGAVMVFHDVTTRRKAEAALRESEQHLQAIFSQAAVGIATAAFDGHLEQVNQRFCDILGYSAQELSTLTIRELTHPDDVPRTGVAMQRLVAGEDLDYTMEKRYLRKDGTVVWSLTTVTLMRDAEGRPTRYVGTIEDITQRKEVEASVRESAQRLQLALEAGQLGDWTWDAVTDCVMLGDRAAAIFGLPPERITTWTLLRPLLHEPDRERDRLALEEAMTSRSVYDIEYRIRGSSGELRWIAAKGRGIYAEDGKILGMAGVVQDITHRKHEAEALIEEYKITEELNEVAKALATELDLNKIVQIVTDAGAKVTGAQYGAFFYNPVDAAGASRLPYSLSSASREAFAEFLKPRGTGLLAATFRSEGVVRLHDVRLDPRFGNNPPDHGVSAGNFPVASYLAAPVFARSGEVLGGLFFGHAEPGVFTEKDEKIIVGVAAQAAAAMNTARLYQAEQQARTAAEEANKTKDHFLATLSHELRTPLTPVLAILSHLREETTLPAPVSEDLEIVRRNVELEARLIDDLLDLTRIARGKLELHLERLAVGPLIENAIATCFPDLKAKGLRLVRDLGATHELIDADGARITQILWNLLKNSIKFTPAGGSITIRSRVVPIAGAQQLTIEFEDTGIGIKPEHLNRVFNAFEQADRKITQQFGGLGLGLAISQAIAEAHQGGITATSEGTGRGSTFTVTLPLAARDHVHISNVAVPSQPAEPAGSNGSNHGLRKKRIMVVEDHVDTATILVRLLRRTGYDVVQAGTVAAALRTASEEMSSAGLDLVISDLSLPDGSGLNVMRELSTRYRLRGIALSGFGMESDIAQSSAAGFARHLIKPVDVAALRRAIAELMQNT